MQILVSVSKRHFKHAVDRNRVKRQLREIWRLHKDEFASQVPADKSLALAFLWLSDTHSPTAVIASRVTNLLQRLSSQL